MRRRANVVGVLIGVVLCAPVASSQPAGSHTLSAHISFVCKWWSQSQMEGMNPNAPPPKNTEVTITRWEYSDPIGTPHPDVVDALLTLHNEGPEPVTDVEIEVAAQWKVGSLRREAAAAWTARTILKRMQGISVRPSATQKLRIPVELKSTMDSLFTEKKWPYALRITATVRRRGSTEPVAQTKGELPIRPAD